MRRIGARGRITWRSRKRFVNFVACRDAPHPFSSPGEGPVLSSVVYPGVGFGIRISFRRVFTVCGDSTGFAPRRPRGGRIRQKKDLEINGPRHLFFLAPHPNDNLEL